MKPLLLFLALVGAPALARADLFSPGPLAKPHAHLEGLRNCTSCHEAGSGLSQQRCYSCHPEIQKRVDAGQGFHARIAVADRDCQKCHHEHRGAEFALIDWGRGGLRAFDHARAGFALEGAHAKVECKKCHDARLIAEADARKLSAKRTTFLGAPRDCKSCHFDEHRGQLAGSCAGCHDSKAFKPATGFDHGKTKYALLGKHRSVACEKCHPAQTAETAAGAFPAPRSATFLKFSKIEHGSCDSCHQDPHEGRFGARCESCHVVDGWSVMGGPSRERAFHEKTRYPLRGAHAAVACKSCHGPLPGKPARFKGLAFKSCTDCHADAHLGQMAKTATCEGCHDVNGFRPARFDIEAHARTKYALAGAHLAVPCASCHPDFDPLKRRITRAIDRRGRKLLVSLARFEFPSTGDCQTCHEDPHQGQFQARVKAGGCPSCHQLTSFAALRFDHGKDTGFPLTGKHAGTACASCHKEERKGKARFVRYKPLSGACTSCHADAHATQLAGADGTTDCTRCHDTSAFAPAPRYVHAPPFTSFRLEGKHAQLACDRCHARVDVGRGVRVARYRGLPTTCEGCHADFHRGSMRRFAE